MWRRSAVGGRSVVRGCFRWPGLGLGWQGGSLLLESRGVGGPGRHALLGKRSREVAVVQERSREVAVARERSREAAVGGWGRVCGCPR